MTLNPIATLPAFDPEVDVEGYCQELLNLWLRRYFSAVPFSYVDHHGATVSATWPKCELGFEETVLPASSLQRPLIHLYHPGGATSGDCCGSVHRMICEVLVPATLATVAELPGQQASHWVRYIADRLHYLLESREIAALVPGGIVRIEPLSRPSVQPALTGLYRRSFPIQFTFCP